MSDRINVGRKFSDRAGDNTLLLKSDIKELRKEIESLKKQLSEAIEYRIYQSSKKLEKDNEKLRSCVEYTSENAHRHVAIKAQECLEKLGLIK